ncbi:MAG: hypothetical protein JJ966_12755 [Balneolaceae bacterium]|nr:hypothetical protein [Balneolaceae bacterium]
MENDFRPHLEQISYEQALEEFEAQKRHMVLISLMSAYQQVEKDRIKIPGCSTKSTKNKKESLKC